MTSHGSSWTMSEEVFSEPLLSWFPPSMWELCRLCSMSFAFEKAICLRSNASSSASSNSPPSSRSSSSSDSSSTSSSSNEFLSLCRYSSECISIDGVPVFLMRWSQDFFLDWSWILLWDRVLCLCFFLGGAARPDVEDLQNPSCIFLVSLSRCGKSDAGTSFVVCLLALMLLTFSPTRAMLALASMADMVDSFCTRRSKPSSLSNGVNIPIRINLSLSVSTKELPAASIASNKSASVREDCNPPLLPIFWANLFLPFLFFPDFTELKSNSLICSEGGISLPTSVSAPEDSNKETSFFSRASNPAIRCWSIACWSSPPPNIPSSFCSLKTVWILWSISSLFGCSLASVEGLSPPRRREASEETARSSRRTARSSAWASLT